MAFLFSFYFFTVIEGVMAFIGQIVLCNCNGHMAVILKITSVMFKKGPCSFQCLTSVCAYFQDATQKKQFQLLWMY